jgi:hypothetical protein
MSMAERFGNALAHKTSRRGFIGRAAVIGSALVVNPLRFVLTPQSAEATVWDCNYSACGGPNALHCNLPMTGTCLNYADDTYNNYKGGCGDGYTAFCCSLEGGDNDSCPDGSFVGGWWKANQNSSTYCGGGNRYIIDCNAFCLDTGTCDQCTGNVHADPDGQNPWCSNDPCSTGCIDQTCHCKGSNCVNRKESCNWFRYGQCRQNVQCSGPVVCRLTRCSNRDQPPWVEFSCTNHNLNDWPTACHDAGCLTAYSC